MIELTEQQRQELELPEPIAIDPQTKQTYVLVRQAAYERLKSLLHLDVSPRATASRCDQAELETADPVQPGNQRRSSQVQPSALRHSEFFSVIGPFDPVPS